MRGEGDAIVIATKRERLNEPLMSVDGGNSDVI